MKYVVLVADGMGDYPLDELGDRTPLEVAKTPYMDRLAAGGMQGTAVTLPNGLPLGSDVGNLSILGYDPYHYYVGRGPLEAANMEIPLADDQIAFRCNLITVENDTLIDYSAGHISTQEATVLIEHLNNTLGGDTVRFYPGMGYRHLAIFTAGPEELEYLAYAACTPPHDIMGKSFPKYFPKGEGGDLLHDYMVRSVTTLLEHEVNTVRIDLKENPANMIWLWGQGKRPNIPSFRNEYGVDGSLISAVDLVKGLGKLLGLDVMNVPGATGYYDTNYEGKAEYGINALGEHDFLLIHVEAIDEAGHNGDLREKIAAIEKFDKHIVGSIVDHLTEAGETFRVLIMPDHFTPIAVRTHTADAVPYLMYGTGITSDEERTFSEATAIRAAQTSPPAWELMKRLIS